MRRTGSIVGIATALLLVGGVAVASIPDASGVIHACYKTSNPAQGALIAIDSAASCPSGYAALNWNQTGPQGPAGVSGREVVRTTLEVGADSYGPGQGFSLYAFCPTGKVTTGGGGEGVSSTLVQGSRPYGDAAWLMLFRVSDSVTTFPAFTLEAYAICVAAT